MRLKHGATTAFDKAIVSTASLAAKQLLCAGTWLKNLKAKKECVSLMVNMELTNAIVIIQLCLSQPWLSFIYSPGPSGEISHRFMFSVYGDAPRRRGYVPMFQNINFIVTKSAFQKGVSGTLNFAETEGWNFAEIEGCKVADTIFLRDGKLPTLFF